MTTPQQILGTLGTPGSNYAASSNYAAKLLSEQWQAFARDIRKQRNNACQSCHRSDIQIEVHHIFYDSNREPWDYKPEELAVLCRTCHGALHAHLKEFRKYVFSKLNPQSFQVLNGALAVAFEQYNPLVFAHALAEFVSNPRLVQNHADAWDARSTKQLQAAP